MPLPWPWRRSESGNGGLLPLTTPSINGVDRDYGLVERSRPESRSKSRHARTTSTQSRVSPLVRAVAPPALLI